LTGPSGTLAAITVISRPVMPILLRELIFFIMVWK